MSSVTYNNVRFDIDEKFWENLKQTYKTNIELGSYARANIVELDKQLFAKFMYKTFADMFVNNNIRIFPVYEIIMDVLFDDFTVECDPVVEDGIVKYVLPHFAYKDVYYLELRN